MRNTYLATLYDLAKKDDRVLAIVADNGAVVYDKYRQDFPDRFINCGIAEANMISIAAGLASCGKIPFTYTISNFITMRAFEQVRNDICLQRMNVKLVGVGVGFIYSSLGPTHHAVEDVALMSALPNMTIFSPADPIDTKNITIAAHEISGPVYIRLAASKTPSIYEKEYAFKVGRGVVLRAGKDLSIITTGNITHEVIKAVDELEALGISARLVNMHTLKPIDRGLIIDSAFTTGGILTIEEHSIHGGLGSLTASVLVASKAPKIPFKTMGLNNTFPNGYGSYEDMKQMNGLAKKHIVEQARMIYEKKGEFLVKK